MNTSTNIRRLSKGKDILHRIGVLEAELEGVQEHFQNLTRGLDAILGTRDRAFQRLDEVLAAVVNLLGEDKVLEEINLLRKSKAEKAAAASFDALEASKKSGVAVPGELVTDKSLLVVEQFKADGTPEFPARVPVSVFSLSPEQLAQVLGKGVGTQITEEDGDYLIVSEIYGIDEARVTQIEAEALEKAAQEAAEVTGADAE